MSQNPSRKNEIYRHARRLRELLRIVHARVAVGIHVALWQIQMWRLHDRTKQKKWGQNKMNYITKHFSMLVHKNDETGMSVGDAMADLFTDVIENLDDRLQIQFFCGAWGLFEANAMREHVVTLRDVDNMRAKYESFLAKQNHRENTFPCDCGADLNDGEILETNKIKCRSCGIIKTIET